MSVTISWQKSWSSSDDGSILYGADLQNLQTNIEAHTHTEDVETTGDQTVAGIKTFSGTLNITGTFQISSVAVTSTAAELNILDGATIIVTELNYLKGVTNIIIIPDEFLFYEGATVELGNNFVYYR